MSTLESGPKLDWTRDNQMYEHYRIWRKKIEFIFCSALADSTPKQLVSYLKYWMGDQGIPLLTPCCIIGSTNPCRITHKEFLMKQTKMYVCTLEEFILVDIWIHCSPASCTVQQCIQISTRINSSSVHTYIFVCFIRNSLRVILQGFVDPIMQRR